jgi:hypothetical protein
MVDAETSTEREAVREEEDRNLSRGSQGGGEARRLVEADYGDRGGVGQTPIRKGGYAPSEDVTGCRGGASGPL